MAFPVLFCFFLTLFSFLFLFCLFLNVFFLSHSSILVLPFARTGSVLKTLLKQRKPPKTFPGNLVLILLYLYKQLSLLTFSKPVFVGVRSGGNFVGHSPPGKGVLNSARDIPYGVLCTALYPCMCERPCHTLWTIVHFST